MIFAYRFRKDDDSEKELEENVDSDGDHRAGLNLMKEMRKKAVFGKLPVATRSCAPDFAHIGQSRSQHVIDVLATSMNHNHVYIVTA